jgi:hypothetical protein
LLISTRIYGLTSRQTLFYLSIVYLTVLSVSRIIQSQTLRRLANSVLERILKISVFQKHILSTPDTRIEILLGGVPNTNTHSAMVFSFIRITEKIPDT